MSHHLQQSLMSSCAPQHDKASSPPWGDPNDLRGRNYRDLAIKFKRAYPEGSILTVDQFDAWAVSEGCYRLPSDEDKANKKSDAWLALLQRRHQARHNLNQAATHPSMNTAGVGAYALIALKGGLYKVEAPHEQIAEHSLTSKVASLVHTKKRQLNYLMQSADWTLLPPYERMFAETLYEDIDKFEEDIDRGSAFLSRKFLQLADKLKAALESGQIHPSNGGIRQLLAPPPVGHDATLEPDGEMTEDEEPYC